MDYVKQVAITTHDDLPTLLAAIGDDPIWLTSGLGGAPHWSARYASNAWIFLGKESAGLPESLLVRHPDRITQIPMIENTRGLNISTSAGIVLYEALRQLALPSGHA